jgi:hypothetical protein
MIEMKNKNKFFVIVLGLVFVISVNLSNPMNEHSNLDLNNLTQKASAACEITTTIGGISLTIPCKSKWCQSTFSYYACGDGNGTTCNDKKSCPK